MDYNKEKQVSNHSAFSKQIPTPTHRLEHKKTKQTQPRSLPPLPSPPLPNPT